MTELNTLVEQLAAAYLLARGREFKHLGVVLPLDRDVLTMAIQRNKAFCADVRQMLDEGKDPLAELAREQRGRAMQ